MCLSVCLSFCLSVSFVKVKAAAVKQKRIAAGKWHANVACEKDSAKQHTDKKNSNSFKLFE